ncbi:MAG TPA: efflux RND transporter permease subunit [Longimicrobiaceae bacterium]|nr:efflux RND transporter permease subunit [Longimicrobiaceae bacterium]
MSLFDALVRQRRFVYLVVALLSAAGVAAALALPSSIYPELKFPRITVVAQGTALGARQQMFSVTRPIEEAVSVVPGLERVRSRSIRGGSEISLSFSPGTDMVVALQLVEARINQARPDMPAGLEIEAERMLPSLFPIVTYNVTGRDAPELYDLARYRIRPALAGIPGVGHIEVQGSEVRQVEVVADPARLATAGLSYDDLATAIRQALGVQAVGRVDRDYKQYLVLRDAEAHAVADVADVVVRGALRVGDVATVSMGTEDRTRLVRGDGRPAAVINVARQAGGSTLAVADSVDATMAALQRVMPAGVRIQKVYDQAALVREAVGSVRDAMLLGALLAVVILLLFLRHGRITAISAASIPLTMAITVFLMKLSGATFNLMSLGGMAIAIGLVIDDAVVVTENIARHLALHRERRVAVREAIAELVWPVTTSTLTTVVVFLPLGLLQGVVGQFFVALSTTLVVAVLVSLALAMTLVPLLADQFVEPTPATPPRSSVVGRQLSLTTDDRRLTTEDRGGARGEWLDRLTDAYSRALDRVLHHGRALLMVGLLLVVGGMMLYRFVGTGFLPVMDEGAFVLDYATPTGTALAETDRQLHIVEAILDRTPEVMATTRRTGAEMGLFATEENSGDMVVRLKPRGERSRSVFEVVSALRTEINQRVPRLQIEFTQILSDLINDLSGSAEPVEIKLFGDRLGALEAYAERISPRIERVDGVVDLYDGVADPAPELLMHVSPTAAARIGLTPEQVAAQARAAMLGAMAGEVRSGEQVVDVRVHAPDGVRFDPRRLGSIPIFGSGSSVPTPLSALATFADSSSQAELLRENQQQMIAITAGVEGRSLGDVMGDVRSVLAADPPPPGVRLELGGQYAGQQEAFRSMLLVLALAALSVVGVMLVQFESFIEPLVILVAAPLSFVGAVALLLVTGTQLNVSSLMGLILLVGLIVKNGIILLDFTRHRMRYEGEALGPAVRAAARVRLRPILMTTLCTLFGLLPLALGIGAGAEMQRPLALAVIGGLALSTPVTLFVVPTLLVAIRGRGYALPREA